eukprot:gnl/TRDRNA2_/TRDRNA2_126403_c0_seq1.p1 gnl/TRDRNA2_/TRDRNA2_126403_c0~~gnl/TRDRNA2_/TRDRNA2_126403_c0_seq1.p1  ORF type:complete len:657 (+),score=109.71 gnl/TRDRNA2_/TRDRNA2_126403_c0_seq1:91-2061(+)
MSSTSAILCEPLVVEEKPSFACHVRKALVPLVLFVGLSFVMLWVLGTDESMEPIEALGMAAKSKVWQSTHPQMTRNFMQPAQASKWPVEGLNIFTEMNAGRPVLSLPSCRVDLTTCASHVDRKFVERGSTVPAVETLSLHGSVAWEMHKFGGASLANAGLYRAVGDILIEESTKGQSPIPTAAVVSAMKGMTDKLIGTVEKAAEEGGQAEAKEMLENLVKGQMATVRELLDGHPELMTAIESNIHADSEDISAILRSLSLLRVAPSSTTELVAGQGEIWSAQLLSAYLKTKGVPTAWMNARDVLVVGDGAAQSGVGSKGAALDMRVEPMYDETAKRLEAWWLDESKDFPAGQAPIIVIAGFVASTLDGVPTTLKRSGSDYSATIFGRLLKASQMTLWKNVDGISTADPGQVPKAMTIKAMSYDEANELAYFGGQVIHPTAMLPAMMDNTPVYVRNVLNPKFAGTTITRQGINLGRAAHNPVKFITSIPDISVVTMQGGSGDLSVSKILCRAMGAIDDAGVKVVLVTQACASHSLSLAVDAAEGTRAVEAIQAAFELELSQGKVEGVSQETGYSILSVIGDDMAGYVGTTAKLANAIASCGISINAIAQGTSERSITIVVKKSQLNLAMNCVHDAFSGSAQAFCIDGDACFTPWGGD